ncbi:hypothetical protein VC83_03164 [Pseudogymnoascus destructans]|uniref:Uncharacterized protein n=2 Tax=Pseudogymnoascus destructans TaxID=655981 RepID=L8G9S0_PSED2|nr:uncharacterized protein VC83_03164 [Pseudogymnoascus destructans]ELR09403.1 hypothetical protein GMDG_03967 [Pseudogymnoascus destructans 20631-21]OAF60022.1 hypothetical protein VC83_03164 [Pseudogymnoascus destructans]
MEIGGMVRVDAICSDGEGTYVRVDKAEVKNTAIKGTYLWLAMANEAAREYPEQEWDIDLFEEYTETVHNGMVAIKTRCGEELGEMEEELEDSMSESDDE